ncbi:hypothetical protein BDD12DRAFT_819700 [Trichophaea hybrida]|nr:hypothetical protein BDD12DRAFT_819700 [Trichophaea hybrida]
MFLDLEKHLVFYGTYHSHPTNIHIHIIFVPILMFTIMLLLSNLTLSFSAYLNLSTLISIIYALLYILMEPFAGSLLAPLVVLQSLLGTWCVQRFGVDASKVAAVVQVFAWFAQFIGHGVYEKRAPALVDNLLQALFLAPLFVWIEVLFMGGYRPELRGRLEVKVKEKRREMEEREGMGMGKGKEE